MNLKYRRIIGLGVLLLLLGLCQIWAPLTLWCVVSASITAAICIISVVVLLRKKLFGKKTENPLMAPARIPFWFAGMSGIIYNQMATSLRVRSVPFLQDLIWRILLCVQWVCLLTVILLAVMFAYSFWEKRRSSV